LHPKSTATPATAAAGSAGVQPDLDLAWRADVSRFDPEHTVRFCTQMLGWTTPRPRHPEQADRWTWTWLALASAAIVCGRLVRQLATDPPLPWERPDRPASCPLPGPPGFPRLLCALGLPAAAPNPSGRSPGRPKGRCSGPARHSPAINKSPTKPRTKPSKTPKAT
jgi:hypothetical protein